MDCDIYFQSYTAVRIWQEDDQEGQNRMFSCLAKVHKEDYFRKVIYRNSRLDYAVCRDLAENAFLTAWEAFNRNGKAGKLQINKPQYTGYFYTAFRGNYLKLFENELKKLSAEKGFMLSVPLTDDGSGNGEDIVRMRVQKTLDKMSPDCRKLLEWKHMQGLSHDAIAERKQITRDSSIKMLSRCAMRFVKLWNQRGQ